MRYENISAAIARFVAVITAVREFIGTETVAALRLHLLQVRMPLGMSCYSGSTSHRHCPPCDTRGPGLKRDIKPAAKRQGNSPWQINLLQTPRPAAGLGLANC